MPASRVPENNSVCTLILVRHAASKGGRNFVGQNDEPLTSEGRQQLKALVAKLSRFRFQAVFASDLERALETAREAVKRRDLKLQIRPNLREMHFGPWQGLSWNEIAKRDPRLARLWMKHFPSQPIPGAERFARFKNRIRTELKRIVEANRRGSVLVVTHAGVIRVALADALGMKDKYLFRLAQDPCAVNVVDYFPDGVTVRCVNG
jgi:broad specificity phosphatase PhoE